MARVSVAMKFADRLNYKAALVEMLSRHGGLFHITARLPLGSSGFEFLEDRLRAWDARVNRSFLGRNWYLQRSGRMTGVVFFERWPNVHAHLVVRPPAGAPNFRFQLDARWWFQPQPLPELKHVSPKAVTCGGRMHIQRITETDADLRRVLSYDAKDIERRADAVISWKFIDQLSPLTP